VQLKYSTKSCRFGFADEIKSKTAIFGFKFIHKFVFINSLRFLALSLYGIYLMPPLLFRL